MLNTIKNKTSLNNWNEKVLVIEETILTPTKKETIGSLAALYKQYKESIETEISLYPYNKTVKELLNKRLKCIESFVKLKVIFSKEPNLDEHSQEQLLAIQKQVHFIIKRLNQHSQAIQTNQKGLKKIGADEQHIQPYIFNMLADAYDYLATSEWNLINTLNLEESVVTCTTVFLHYKERVNSLRLLTTYEQSDKEIEDTFEKMQETIEELRKLITTHEPRIAFNKNEELQKELAALQDQDLRCVKTEKRQCSSPDSRFFKKPKTEQASASAIFHNELHSSRYFTNRS